MNKRWRNVALTLAATVVLSGSALAQGPGFGPGPRGPRGGGGGMLLRMPEVQAELKLTDDQKTKVEGLLEQLRSERQGQFQSLRDLSPEEGQKRLAEWRASEEKQINTILTGDQQKRYRQLQLQQQGTTALADRSVADELKLTEAQRAKIQSVLEEQRESMRSFFPGRPGGPGGPPPRDGAGPGGGPGGPGGPPRDSAGPGGGPGGFDPQAMRTRMETLRKQTDEKITALLTDDQKKQWKEMLGASFTFPAFGPGGRGGFGPGGPRGPSGPPRGELRPGI